jgi:4-alpha-glucanotransferase
VERVAYTRRALHLPSDLPAGYHRLHWECQAYLAASEAGIVLVNLEDLWGEIEPQNRPGTYREYPNWQRPARWAIDEFRLRADVRRILETVHHRRQSGAGKGGREEGERC